MQKILFLFLSLFLLIHCVPRIRNNLNLDEEKLAVCLKEEGIKYNEEVEELRGYYDALRTYLFNKKFTEFGFKEDDKLKMQTCFDQYGLGLRMVSPYSNCMDVCKDQTPGKRCNCPRY